MLTRRVESFLLNASADSTPLTKTEREQFLNFLRRHLVEMFNYTFVSKYRYRRIKVFRDRETDLRYVITDENHRLYFPRGWKAENVRGVYNSLCCEQDELSPHNYCFHDLSIDSESVIADVGAAEGMFTLKFIDKIKTAYLFECDNGWLEALQASFSPWKEKVVIVNKYVSDVDSDEAITLDHFFSEREKPTLIKIDVEGAESDVLKGAETLLNNGIRDMIICTYHKKGDEQSFSRQLAEKKFKIVPSPGYMLLITEMPDYSIKEPFDFRRGLIHASRA